MYRHHILFHSLSAIRSGVLVVLSLVLVLSSCTNDDLHLQQQGTVSMVLDGGVQQFDETRASRSFVDGDKLYVRLDNGTYGTATYLASTSSWTFSFSGSLSTGTSGSCALYYVNDPVSSSSKGATLNAHSAVYVGNGTYSRNEVALIVKATLSPQVGRLRFKGTSGTSLTVSGITYYTSLDVSKSTLSSTSSSITLSVGSNGYTSYVYGSLGSDRQLQVITGGSTFSRTCSSSVLSAGHSGYLDCPTSSSHSGWSMQGGSPSAAGHAYVDLGLPSGTMWATCNVGASKPEEYGDYYAWGETETKSTYSWSTYKWCKGSYDTQTKYCTSSSYGTVDDKKELDLEDDVAHVKWGGDWRMPTDAELTELRTKCTWTWTTQNSVKGYKVTGSNGNSLFLPAAGYRYGTDLDNASSYGYYWSRSLDTDYPGSAWGVYFNSSYVGRSYGSRCRGQSVRPVLAPQN